jgi:hypothetical protein
MTTLTDKRACPKDTGLLIRDCDCHDCEAAREEFIELHDAMARAWLSNRPLEEREERVFSIQQSIKRYKVWL